MHLGSTPGPIQVVGGRIAIARGHFRLTIVIRKFLINGPRIRVSPAIVPIGSPIPVRSGTSLSDDGWGNLTTGTISQKFKNYHGQAKLFENETESETHNHDLSWSRPGQNDP
jgi:hypothetical protein